MGRRAFLEEPVHALVNIRGVKTLTLFLAALAAAIAAAALLALLFQRDNVGVLPMLSTLVFMAPLALGKPGFNALRR